MKPGAWLVNQWQPRQAGHPRVRRERVVDRRAERLRMGASDRASVKVAIRQPGAMRQQIAERDWTRRLVGLIEWTIRVAQHAHARQLACALRDGLVEIETPLVEQRQRGDGRDRFR